MYIILWKDKPVNNSIDTSNYKWSAMHSVFDDVHLVEEWLYEFQKDYGELVEYRIAKLEWVDRD